MNHQRKGHRASPFKSVTHPSDPSQTPTMDSDFDTTFPVEQDDLFPSQKVVTDSVKWQSSQLSSCAALNNLILEIPARRKIAHDTSWYNQEASTSTSSQPAEVNNSRPLVRTNSRARFGRLSEPDVRNPPDLNLFNKKDPMQFLDLLKGVSERVDENVGLRGAKGGDLSGIKRKTRAPTPSTSDVNAKNRGSRPTYMSVGPNKANRTAGKHRADGGGDTEYESQSPDGTYRSLPHLSSSTSTIASSSSLRSANTSISMDVDASMSMDTMDVSGGDQSFHFPSISKRHPTTHQKSSPSESMSARASPDPSTAIRKVTPAPRLHPLLSQQKPHPQKHPPPKPQIYPPAQPQRVPPMSQTTNPARKPALGMRRTASVPTTAPANNALPMRQRGFKPPLLPGTQPQPTSQQPTRQPQPLARPAAKVSPPAPVPQPGGRDVGGGKFARPSAASGSVHLGGNKPPSRPRAASPEADPDSSFGDMSFDMDVDALEETMRMYD